MPSPMEGPYAEYDVPSLSHAVYANRFVFQQQRFIDLFIDPPSNRMQPANGDRGSASTEPSDAVSLKHTTFAWRDS